MDFQLLKELCSKKGVSGDEREIAEFTAIILEPYADYVEISPLNNVFAFKKGASDKTLMLDAHLDTIGLIVKEKLERGFLSFDLVGGVASNILPASEVLIGDTLGIISSKPPHLMSEDERKKAFDIKNMYIDTGDMSENIKVGDTVCFSNLPEIMGDCVSGSYLDNRAGVCALIEVFREVDNLPFNLALNFTAGEEMGFKGAKALKKEPDMIIAVDVTHGETPDEKRDMVFKCGKGTAIATGPNIHPFVFEKLKETCIKNNLDYQIEVLEDSTGTNAWAYQVTGNSVPCGLLSFPLKYMHTPVETMNISDYDNLKEILKTFILDLDGFPANEEVL